MRKSSSPRNNPGSRNFGQEYTAPAKVLWVQLRKNRPLRKEAQVYNFAKLAYELGPKNYPVDMGTCWMCWLQLTHQGLEGYKKFPYSEERDHPVICPLCEYPRWKGRIWYPFYYIHEVHNISANP